MVLRDIRGAGKCRLMRRLCFFAALLAWPALTRADSTAFDLKGTRNGKPLPISDVPNLQAGDRIWIHPDFPEDQSARYLLIVAFLRGSTNPPPENWFTRAESWN